MKTPCFPAFRARLSALGTRVQRLRQQSLLDLDRLFGPWLPPGLLAQADDGANSRERIYTVRRTFFGFLYQILNPQCPCREIVRQIQALLALYANGPVAAGTGGWCQARIRLPWDILPRLRCSVAAQAEKTARLWRGWQVKVVDGTSTSLPDTAKNQRAYPQPGGQKPGCGFPLLKLVGVFSLASGALLDYAKGNKHQHELSLLHKLMDQFKAGDLVLADRGFNSYTLLALLLLRRAQSLFRLHQRRPADLRTGKRLGKNDRLMTWRKPRLWQRPRYLSKAIWKGLPAQLSVRVVRFTLAVPGFRVHSVTLVTTLLDPVAYPAQELARLYARRWQIELWFRDLKTSMGMEALRCKSPGMAHKELEMFFIAYNLIRVLMAQASALYEVPMERLSFKGTVDALRQFSLAMARARSRKKQKQLTADLLEIIARDQVPERPGRREPRAVKRRPKPHPLLNRPRHQFKEISHRDRYWKNNPRKPKS
jgi:IS4 transposase